MTFFPNNLGLFSSLFGDEAITAVFSDEQFVRNMLHVEGALAIMQGDLGIIPVDAATQIANAAASLDVDFAQMQAGIEKAGVPVIALVQQLRKHVGKEAADYVHWGATTQDVMDTAVILQIREALRLLEPKLQQTICQLAQLADKHRHTLMAGRTHSQQALPITFGFKVAGWLAPLLRHQQRLAEMKPRLLVVQFGGAAGTLAALGERGMAVQTALAAQLNLGVPLTPWHTQRDTLAEFANWLSLVSGSLAKMAQDIILMAQSEVGEVRETADPSRGGSSTMPQKSNPIISELIISAARTNASLLANMHQAMVQEHERATHGWQMEWLTLPQMVGLTAVSLNKSAFLSQNLVVNTEKMRQNVAASNGLMLAEAISFALADYMSRAEAKVVIKTAVQQVLAENRHLIDVLREQINLPLLDWASLSDEQNYLGSASQIIDRVLNDIE